MSESVIWELDLPPVTVDDLFKVQGNNNNTRPPRPSIRATYEKMLAKALLLVKPVIIWREVDVLGTSGKQLLLRGGYKLTSPVLTVVAGTADKLIIYAATVGGVLDEEKQRCSHGGRLLEAVALDAAGIAILLHSSKIAVDKISAHYQGLGLDTTFHMGPGHSYWPGLEDMQVIFDVLQAQKIGLRLTNNNLIWPPKSMAMVLGAGPNLPDFKGKTHCDFCSMSRKCQLSHYGQQC